MSQLEGEIQRSIEEGHFPGAALLISRRGEILFRKFCGSASLVPEKEALTERTLFDIASLTKPVATATLALLARNEKRLSLDTPVSRQLKELAEGDKEKITVRHLLKHTSGLPDWRPYFEEIQRDRPDLLGRRECATVYLEKISQEPLEVPVAYQKIYSDLGFILLGIALEQIFGQPLDQLFREKVAGPLGLTQTFYIPNDQPPPDQHRFAATEESRWRKKILRAEVHDENTFTLGGVAGHAGLFSTMDDLHIFLREFAKGFRGQSDFFPKDLVQEFVGSRVKFKLGWDIPSGDSQSGKYFSRNSIGHLGFTGCSFWVDLDQDFHIILLTNRVHPTSKNEGIKKVRPRLHDLAFEEFLSK